MLKYKIEKISDEVWDNLHLYKRGKYLEIYQSINNLDYDKSISITTRTNKEALQLSFSTRSYVARMKYAVSMCVRDSILYIKKLKRG